MDEDVELVRAFLSEVKEGGTQLSEDIVKRIDFLKASIDDLPGRSSEHLEYAVNWIKEGIDSNNDRVKEGESLFRVMAVNTEGQTVHVDTKLADKDGKIILLKKSGFVEEGENIAALVDTGDEKNEDESDRRVGRVTKSEDDKKSGTIYILKNDEMPNIVKIGYTKDSPEERAKELSSSEVVPSSYNVFYKKEVCNPEVEERRIHIKLSESRITPKREFFKVSLEKAKKAIRDTTGKEKLSDSGYVCIFKNKVIPNLIIIDSTDSTPAQKARDMSEGTGVPSPYKVAFVARSRKHIKVELETKKELTEYKEYNKFYDIKLTKASKVIKKYNDLY